LQKRRSYSVKVVKGMRVMLRWNVTTELGLTNGAEGTVEVVLDPREKLPVSVLGPSEATIPVWHQLEYQPQCVIVEFERLDCSDRLMGFPKKRASPARSACPFCRSSASSVTLGPLAKAKKRASPGPLGELSCRSFLAEP